MRLMRLCTRVPPFCLMAWATLCVVSAQGWAETIYLHSGQTVEGKILKEDAESILVDAGIDVPVTYFRDEIQKIEQSSLPVPPVLSGGNPEEADQLESQAVELLEQDDFTQVTSLYRKAIALDPAPQRHMNFGSILFGNGVSLFKAGKTDESKAILKEAQEQLNLALKGFNPDLDAPFIGQCYFLLGEILSNAMGEVNQAKQYYQKAVIVSDHDGAKAAMARLSDPVSNP